MSTGTYNVVRVAATSASAHKLLRALTAYLHALEGFRFTSGGYGYGRELAEAFTAAISHLGPTQARALEICHGEARYYRGSDKLEWFVVGDDLIENYEIVEVTGSVSTLGLRSTDVTELSRAAHTCLDNLGYDEALLSAANPSTVAAFLETVEDSAYSGGTYTITALYQTPILDDEGEVGFVLKETYGEKILVEAINWHMLPGSAYTLILREFPASFTVMGLEPVWEFADSPLQLGRALREVVGKLEAASRRLESKRSKVSFVGGN